MIALFEVGACELVAKFLPERGLLDFLKGGCEVRDDLVLGALVEIEFGKFALDLGSEGAVGVILQEEAIEGDSFLLPLCPTFAPSPFIEGVVCEIRFAELVVDALELLGSLGEFLLAGE